MSLKDLSNSKKFAMYTKLLSSGLIDKLETTDLSRYDTTKEELNKDIDTNYHGILISYNKTDNESDKELTILETNKPPGNFKWTEENIPLISQDYFVYDNTTGTSWDSLKNHNSYPKPLDNNGAIVREGEDDFTTYNNRTFANYFNHTQSNIKPKNNQSLDAWFDVGLRAVMYNRNIPYTSPNFQKTFYVWYINGDGTDYPYVGAVGYTYPGQEVNFRYKYENIKGVIIKSASFIKIKGDTPNFRYDNVKNGFFAQLLKPNEHCNCIAKIDLGLLESVGQKWHYQGFTLKSFPIFSRKPTDTIKLEMKGDEIEMDITKLIDVSLTWEFESFTITSSNESVCKVEHDWEGRESNPKYILGPSYIKLIGNQYTINDTVTITVTANPVRTNYVETFTFDVNVVQLYNKETLLDVTPKLLLVMTGKEEKFEVTTDAVNYSVTSDNNAYIKLYKDKILGVKPGNGVLTFKAQAPMSMPAVVKVPFTVTKYIPTPKIGTDIATLSIESGKIKELEFNTNCPISNIIIEVINNTVATTSDITWKDQILYDDKLALEYPTRFGIIPIRGLVEGVTELKIKGFITNGEGILTKTVILTVTPIIEEDTITPDSLEDDGKPKFMSKTDAYLSFHHQHEGIFTYLRSKGRTELKEEELEELIKNREANKIFVMPKVTKEDIEKYNKTDFTLALEEDLVNNEVGLARNTNVNYLDFKEPNNPTWGYQGNPAKTVNTWLNSCTLERFITKKMNNQTVWVGDKGTYVNDIEYPFPGEKGFGVGPAPHDIAMYYGMQPLEGCFNRNSDNYGNYKDVYGSVMVYIPRHYLKYNFVTQDGIKKLHNIDVYYPVTMSSLNYKEFNHPLPKVQDKELRGLEGIIDIYNNKYSELTSSLVMPAAFINNGKLLPGVFVDKYQIDISKRSTVEGKYKQNLSNITGLRPFSNLSLPEYNDNTNDGSINLTAGDTLWAKTLEHNTRHNDIDTLDKVKINRIDSSMSFNTIYIRSMINNLAIAHASRCIFLNTVSNCSWLYSPSGMPNGIKDKDTNYDMLLDITNTDSVDNVRYEDSDLTTHNGQKCGIYGLNNGNLELVIGAMYKLNNVVSNNSINSTTMELNVANKSTDFVKVSKAWSDLINNNGDIKEYNKIIEVTDDLIPSSLVERQLHNNIKDKVYFQGELEGNTPTEVEINSINNGYHNETYNTFLVDAEISPEIAQGLVNGSLDIGSIIKTDDPILNENNVLDYDRNIIVSALNQNPDGDPNAIVVGPYKYNIMISKVNNDNEIYISVGYVDVENLESINIGKETILLDDLRAKYPKMKYLVFDRSGNPYSENKYIGNYTEDEIIVLDVKYIPGDPGTRPIVEKDLVTKPYMLRNSFVPIGLLSNIGNDTTTAKVHDDNSLEYYKYNLGITGNKVKGEPNVKRTNYLEYTYNKDLNLHSNMEPINVGDNRTGFIIDSTGEYSTNDKSNGNFVNYFIPLYNGIVNYTTDNGIIDISNKHFMSVTWYRIGYNINNYIRDNVDKDTYNEHDVVEKEKTTNLTLNVGTRMVILPNMEDIASYYNKYYKKEVEGINNSSNIVNTIIKKDHDPWEEIKE